MQSNRKSKSDENEFTITSTTEAYTISHALTLIKTGVLALALAEHYEIKLSTLIGIVPGRLPKIFFDREGFSKLLKNDDGKLSLIKDSDTHAVVVLRPLHDLTLLLSLDICQQFPFLLEVLDKGNYDNIHLYLEDRILIDRCKSMQTMLKPWGEAGVVHFISCLQALQRQVATKMKRPMSPEFGHITNGLSIEYQCEIYSHQLYGAKLLGIWHHYLMSVNPEKRHPNTFLPWLKTLTLEELNKFNISSLDDISTVCYMNNIEERASWLLQFDLGNRIISDAIPNPKQAGEEIEIIYALGSEEKNSPSQFYGGIKKRGTINHSSFFGGKKVDGAGRMLIKSQQDAKGLSWVVHDVDNNSGHVKPDDDMSLKTLKRLKEIGLDLKRVAWTSKWGSIGAQDETAEIALKRLKNKGKHNDVTENAIPLITSDFINKLRVYSRQGLLGAINSLIMTERYQLTLSESPIAAYLIMNALDYHLQLFGRNTATPDLAKSLASSAIQFLHNVGKNSSELQERFNKQILSYEDNWLLTQRDTNESEYHLSAMRFN